MTHVKSRRSYDSSRRLARARANREAVVSSAHALFLQRGLGATTIAAVASRAGVSPETVYKAFGSKSGLVRAVCEDALAGEGPIPAEERSDALQLSEPDPRAIVAGWGRLTAEVAPRIAPVLLLLDAAVARNPDLAALRDELDQQRWDRMRHNAQTLVDGGHLRPDVDLQSATDVMWTYTSPNLFDLLVTRRGWSPEKFGQFVSHALVAALLP